MLAKPRVTDYLPRGWFYNVCICFSRATIFDHTELAEYLISLVNMVQVQRHFLQVQLIQTPLV